MKKAFMVIFFTSVLLAACASGNEETSSENNPQEVGDSLPAGDIIVATGSDISTLDPHASNDVPTWKVGFNVYDRLVAQNAELEIVPSLAKEWTLIDDVTWEFQLEEDVVFHDGTPFNAEAVKINFDRNLDPETGSPTSYLYEMVNEIEVVSDKTVRFHLDYPFASLPSHLAHFGGSIISPAVIAEDQEAVENGETLGAVIQQKPYGTGPFSLVESIPGEETTLARFEDHWAGAPEIESLTFRVIPEDATRIAELETGGVHVIDPLSPNDVERVSQGEGTNVIEIDSVYTNFLGFNHNKEPFNNVKVRQAIVKAIDKNEIVDFLLDGYGTPAVSPLAPSDFGYADVEGLSYDPQEAKELLEEAGYGDGFDVELSVNDDRTRIDIATYIQAELEEIGISVSIEVMEFGTFVDYTGAGSHELFLLGRSNATGDANNGFFTILHSNKPENNQLRYSYANPELDQLLDAAIEEQNDEDRAAIYKTAQELIVDEAPFDFLYYQTNLLGINQNLKNIEALPTGVILFHNAVLSD
ncbi:glutathione ABC transporter substrate-binding protein [Jeotgalibacillus malaysiensis]|uniref:glutathione ABC transporter substrate-binding protein n=1 Tax=Jeotgalibacillus malaysiensis TaxID=1508404 RepID=UPI00384F4511